MSVLFFYSQLNLNIIFYVKIQLRLRFINKKIEFDIKVKFPSSNNGLSYPIFLKLGGSHVELIYPFNSHV